MSAASARFSSLDRFAERMASAVDTVLTAPGRNVHTVVEMSRMAPFVDAARSIDPTNFANTFISYYTYGQALALGFDLAIREQFPGKTLDDWMRAMWREHPDIDKPYTLQDLQQTLGEVTNPPFARDMFKRHIYGLEPIDFAALLPPAGLLLRKERPDTAWLGGSKLEFSEDSVTIASNTLRASPLYNAGLDIGDRILRWNGKQMKTSADLTAWLAKHKPGETVRLQVESRGRQTTCDLLLGENPTLEIVTFERAGQSVTPEIQRFRHAWLASKALHPLPPIPPMP